MIALGIIATGCIFTGTNPSYTSHELKHHATASKAKFIISEPDILGNISSVAKILSLPLFILNANGSSGFPSWRTLLNYDEEDWVRFDSQQKSQTTTAMLLFSSGTTGLPKPAILSNYNLIAQHTLAFEHQPPPYLRKRLVPLPLFHAATAPSTITGALRSGHPNYIMARFEPTLYLQNVQRFSITDLVLVPPMVVSLVNLPSPATAKSKAEQLKSVRFAAAGAAPLDKEMQARLQALLPHDAPFTQVWAMTETSCFASAFPWPENDNTGSVGRFLPGLDVKLVDDDGKEIEAYDKPGELCIRGPTVIRGYLDNPQANARDFDTDGYFHTGDILYCDGETKLWYIIDRKKELIKVRGFQVAPAEIEGVLLEYEAVLDVAVIGVKVGRDEEVPRAYVVLKPGMEGVSEQSIKSFTGTRLAGYKRLDGGEWLRVFKCNGTELY